MKAWVQNSWMFLSIFQFFASILLYNSSPLCPTSYARKTRVTKDGVRSCHAQSEWTCKNQCVMTSYEPEYAAQVAYLPVHCQPAMSDCRWLVGLLGLCLICVGPPAGAAPRADLFTNSFLVRFRRNVDQKLAGHVAERNGFVNLGPVSSK